VCTRQPALVLGLELLSKDMVPDVGGKAANLGELARAGLPVPAGFCLTTLAYRRAMAPARLEDVRSALTAAASEDLPALSALAGKARRLVLGATFLPTLPMRCGPGMQRSERTWPWR
jgi:pyruvate,water dikinase